MPDDINVTAVKLPTFWTENAASWFNQAEAQFALRNITQDETKYYHVVSSLDMHTSARANVLMQNPPATNKYTALKNFLLKAYQLSEPERADMLLAMESLGNRRPSQLMSEILLLNGDKAQHFILRQIFMKALPENLRNALAPSKEEDLSELAKEADRLMGTVSSSHTVTAADTDTVKKKNQLCYFHRKFGTRSWRCRQPCSWKSGNDNADSLSRP